MQIGQLSRHPSERLAAEGTHLKPVCRVRQLNTQIWSNATNVPKTAAALTTTLGRTRTSDIAANRCVHPGPRSLADAPRFAADATTQPGWWVLKDSRKLFTNITRIVLLTRRNGTRIRLYVGRNVPQSHVTSVAEQEGDGGICRKQDMLFCIQSLWDRKAT